MRIVTWFTRKLHNWFVNGPLSPAPNYVGQVGNGPPTYNEYQVILRDKKGIAKFRQDFTVPPGWDQVQAHAYHAAHFAGPGYPDYSTLKLVDTNVGCGLSTNDPDC